MSTGDAAVSTDDAASGCSDTPDAGAIPPNVQRAIRFFESISPTDVGQMATLYSPDAWFKDPFNEVRGPGPIGAIFAHMFEQVDAPRFFVRETVHDPMSTFLVWDFEFGFRRPLPGGRQLIRGCSHLRFDGEGRITYHRDYWDAAEELYAKLPILGGLMRLLQRRSRLPGSDSTGN